MSMKEVKALLDEIMNSTGAGEDGTECDICIDHQDAAERILEMLLAIEKSDVQRTTKETGKPETDLAVAYIFHSFANEMEKKFRQQIIKKGYSAEPWKECPINWLLNRLREEAQELYSAMDKYNNISSSMNIEESREVLEEVKEECIDVADFCMFIYNSLKKEDVL